MSMGFSFDGGAVLVNKDGAGSGHLDRVGNGGRNCCGVAGLDRGRGENRCAIHGDGVNGNRSLGYGMAGGEIFLAHRGDADGAIDISDVGDIGE